MNQEHVRNFVIIAHIDHGKSTLADRLLEVTGTVPGRKMRPQYLDQLELERERGITIKMAPVRMKYHPQMQNAKIKNQNDNEKLKNNSAKRDAEIAHFDSYILNLIDTPGHSDFSYEVSRALAAVEGAVLLVDATKGIQAQTLSNLRLARKVGLTIIGAVNKVDLVQSQINADGTRMNADVVEKRIAELATLLQCAPDDILRVSGKTGEGVPELLEMIIEKIPPPSIREDLRDNLRQSAMPTRALIFDSLFNDHKGILAYIRVFEGTLKAGDTVTLFASGAKLKVREVGCFMPELKAVDALAAGEIGYLATGLKEPALVRIGDTVLIAEERGYRTRINADGIGKNPRPDPRESASWALPGYREPTPVIFIAFYPDGTTEFDDLKRAFERLELTDPALHHEPDANEALGRGLKVGFLGQLHFEITSERLAREFGLTFITSFPTIPYRVREGGTERMVTQMNDWPVHPEKVFQPMIKLEIITPPAYLNEIMKIQQTYEVEIFEIHTLGENTLIEARMPLYELVRDFDDQLKSASAGYASFSYELSEYAEADVTKLEILIAEAVQPALTRIVPTRDVEREARTTAERLKDLLPKQQFVQAIQARANGRIVARETIPAMKKLLGNFGKTGGDRTRKMKLWKKQKRGKERLQEVARVSVPVHVFREILKK